MNGNVEYAQESVPCSAAAADKRNTWPRYQKLKKGMQSTVHAPLIRYACEQQERGGAGAVVGGGRAEGGGCGRARGVPAAGRGARARPVHGAGEVRPPPAPANHSRPFIMSTFACHSVNLAAAWYQIVSIMNVSSRIPGVLGYRP